MTTSHKPVQIFVCRVCIALLATYIRCEWPTGAEITFGVRWQLSMFAGFKSVKSLGKQEYKLSSMCIDYLI